MKINLLKQIIVAILILLGLYQPCYAAVTTGVYTVGVGGTYANLAIAITDLNSSTISGPVVFDILPGTYSGANWQMQLTGITGSSPTNTVTFKAQGGPGSVNITVAGTSTANYVFQIADVSYLAIKNLNITNNTSTGYGIVIQLKGACSNDSIAGCSLTSAATTSVTNDAMAVVHLGYGGVNVLSGVNNVVKSNTISGGSIGITAAGTAATPTANNIIDNNNISGNYAYGLYFTNASNIKARNNAIAGTSAGYNTGINLINNSNGLDISGNIININTTSTGSVYGIVGTGINSTSPTTGATTSISNNSITLNATSGTLQTMKITSSFNLLIRNNIATGTVTTGNVNLPTLASASTNVYADNNSFTQTATTTGTIAATAFDMMSSSNNCVVRNNSFISSTTTGSIFNGTFSLLYLAINSKFNKNIFNTTSTTGTQFGYNNVSNPHYWLSYGNNVSMDSNQFTTTSTTGVIGTTTTVNSTYGCFNQAVGNISASYNTFNLTSGFSGTSYGIWGYYSGYGINPANVATTLNFIGNTVNTNLSSTPTFYQFGYYMPYVPFSAPNTTILNFKNNNITATLTSSASYYMCYYLCYQASGEISGNIVNVTENGSGTIYPFGIYNGYFASLLVNKNNTISVSGAHTGSAYIMPYVMAYTTNSSTRNNVYNYNSTSSGSPTAYSLAYGPSTNAGDTAENNTVNFTTVGGTIYNYHLYSNAIVRNNAFNFTNTSGTTYNYCEYPNGGSIRNNTYKLTSTTGTIYGWYDIGTTSYSGCPIVNNRIDVRSTSGIEYAYYGSNPKGNSYIGNVFSTKTSGSSYLLYNSSYNFTDVFFVNNTFHSNSTGATNQLAFLSAGNTTYPSHAYLFNNIFSSSNNVSSPAVSFVDTTYWRADYNLFYAPNTPTLINTNPVVSVTTLQGWRTGTRNDMNSLTYYPGYMDPANFDFRPNPADPNSWSVQGRGWHFPTDTLDFLGNPRAKTRFNGVPDLGAYEFTPTSTPPDAIAIPATPIANTKQVFTFGGDTVCSIQWGAIVPPTVNVKQYTGLQANPMQPATGVNRMFFYDAINTPLGVYSYKPLINYKDPWVGDISSETNARIAKSSNGGTWAGYNFINGITDSVKNILTSLNNFDSLSSLFTGVENARIGIRCVVTPSGVHHSLIAADTVVESWDAVFSPVGYQLIVNSIAATPTLPFTNLQFSGSNVYTIRGLTEDTKYYVHVRSICNPNDTSGWSVDSFTTLPRCHAPILNVNAITDTRAIIYWDTVRLGISYEYVIDQNSGDPAFGTITPNRSVLATGLTPATTYYAHVRSYCNSIYNISVKPDGTPDWSTIPFTTLFPTTVTNSAGVRSGMYVYPNPVRDMVTILLSERANGKAEVSLTDITGKVLRSIEVTNQKIELDMTTVPAGMYMIKYTDRVRTEVTKIIKE